MERIEALQRGGQTVTGVASGFKELDELTSGFQPADLIIVAARPSMGKTAFTLNIAQHAAIEHNTPVAFFSLEMSKESLVQRMLTSEARIDAQRLRKGMLRDDDLPRLARAAGILSSAPVWIDDTPGITLLEMRSKARRLKTDSGVGMIIVDYLQLMQGPANSESRQQEVSQISRGLKALAKELSVPVVALSQLSRAPEQRTGDNKRPQLSDLRESGAIEQDADLIMFLFRQEFYDGPVDKDGNSLEGKAELIIGKQRNGPIGTVNLFFQKQFTRFENLRSSASRSAHAISRLGNRSMSLIRLDARLAYAMAKTKTAYRCTECGAEHAKWQAAATCAVSGTRSPRRCSRPRRRRRCRCATHGRGAHARRRRQHRAHATTPRSAGLERRAMEDGPRRI